jgi:hypothetical protein
MFWAISPLDWLVRMVSLITVTLLRTSSSQVRMVSFDKLVKFCCSCSADNSGKWLEHQLFHFKLPFEFELTTFLFSEVD